MEFLNICIKGITGCEGGEGVPCLSISHRKCTNGINGKSSISGEALAPL